MQVITNGEACTAQEKLYQLHRFMITLHQQMNNEAEQAATYPATYTHTNQLGQCTALTFIKVSHGSATLS